MPKYQINPFTGKLDMSDPSQGVTEDDVNTLTNKTINGDNNTLSNLEHGSEVNNPSGGVHGVSGTIVGTSDIQTLTNKTLNLASNTLTSTLAQLQTAVSDATLVDLAGVQTLINKTIDLASNTLTTTLAQLQAALSDAILVDTAGTQTLTNKTYDADGAGNVLSNIDIGNAIAASQAEAEAGTDNTKLVTSLRVAQAITALGSGAGLTSFAGNFIRDMSLATGTYDVTGVGFQPSVVMVFMVPNVVTINQGSWGFVDSNFSNRGMVKGITAPGYVLGLTGTCMKYLSSDSDFVFGSVTAYGSDGFTMTFTKTGSPTGNAIVLYIALK